MSKIYKVVDAETNREYNFYDCLLDNALNYAKICKKEIETSEGKKCKIIIEDKETKEQQELK